MDSEKPITRFAPAERRSREEVRASFAAISYQTSLPQILDAIPNICLIVNKERQIIFANKALLDFMGVEDRLAVCGMRPGEALNCLHATESPEGCGTTEFCITCGAVNALLTTNDNVSDVRDCRITNKGAGDAMDLRVWTSPVSINGEFCTVLTVADISDERRRRILERVFFHDVLNTAGALRSFCELLARRPPGETEKLQDRIQMLAERLIEEIDTQRELTAAENRELSLKLSRINSGDIMEEVASLYADQPCGVGRSIAIDPQSAPVVFTSDRLLLKRVLGNLLKNALEASTPGETVTMISKRDGDRVRFMVHNQGVMSHEAQLQVFQRSFSTKGTDRGIGTYSVRLLTERYLKGKAEFTSSPRKGTVFTVSYPIKF